MAERPSTHRTAALDKIWAGMPVVDIRGELVGSVKYVKSGDPGAVGLDEQSPAEDGLDTAFARALTDTEPQVGPRFAERLIRTGFLKLSGAGFMDHDCYVAADQIAAADEDKVRLSAAAGELVTQRQQWL